MIIKWITVFLIGASLCGCEKAPDSDSVQASDSKTNLVTQPSDFEARLIQRFEADKREADQIIDRINLSDPDLASGESEGSEEL
jgi:hypothetical protein